MRSTLLLTNFLAIVPFVSASSTRSLASRQSPLIFRDPVPMNDGTGSFILAGCITDSEYNRVLAYEFTAPNGNTPESCLNLCHERGYILGGVENGGASCHCDNGTETTYSYVDESNCEHPCISVKDGTEACGGFNFLLVYEFFSNA